MNTTIANNALSQAVGKWLMKNNFCLADCLGEAFNILDLGRLDVPLDPDHIGILLNRHDEVSPWFPFSLIKKNSRRDFLGVLWFDNATRKATEAKWVFDIYGAWNDALAKQLALRLSEDFHVEIDMRCMSEEPCFEKI